MEEAEQEGWKNEYEEDTGWVGLEEANEAIDKILNLYKEFGLVDYIGEKVSMTQHALQAAYTATKYFEEFPMKKPSDDGQDGPQDHSFPGEYEHIDAHEMILGALLHDLGHILGIAD